MKPSLQPPRISASSYSNTAPLIWSFLYGSQHGKIEIILDNAPARSAELLSQERVDAALVPVIAYHELEGVRLFPDVCVGAKNRVRSVCLEADKSKYGAPMPEELAEVLNQDPEGKRMFHALTGGKQRSLIYWVASVKDVDKRIQLALVMMKHLHDNDGKVISEKLYEESKRPDGLV